MLAMCLGCCSVNVAAASSAYFTFSKHSTPAMCWAWSNACGQTPQGYQRSMALSPSHDCMEVRTLRTTIPAHVSTSCIVRQTEAVLFMLSCKCLPML